MPVLILDIDLCNRAQIRTAYLPKSVLAKK